MPDRKIRTVFEEGHWRKFMVVVDESPEAELALAYAARRARRTNGGLALLYVIEPGDFQHWLGVQEAYREESQAKALAVFRLYGRKLKNWGYEDIEPEEIIREGAKADQLKELIQDDPDIGVLVLGASVESSGPGPLVTTLVSGKNVGSFPIPITVVPGCLTIEEVEALS
jgi:nucleotide-binding universal stress UspA family protein